MNGQHELGGFGLGGGVGGSSIASKQSSQSSKSVPKADWSYDRGRRVLEAKFTGRDVDLAVYACQTPTAPQAAR